MSGVVEMTQWVKQFIRVTRETPHLKYLLTPIGTGIAGYSIEDIAPMFKDIPNNVEKVGWDE